MRAARWILSVAVLALLATPARTQPVPGSVYVRGSVGVATQSLADWNDDIKSAEQFFQGAGLPASFDEFGGAFPVGFEVGFAVSQMVSLGGALSYQKDSVTNTYSDFTGSWSSSADLSLVGLTACLSIWVPSARGFFFGIDAGMGFAKAESEGHLQDFNNPSNNLDVRGDWDGSRPILGVFAGYQRVFPEGLLLFAKGGYQYQNQGHLDGTVTSPQLGSGTAPPTNISGQPMDTDFSGVQLAVGLGFSFGGR